MRRGLVKSCVKKKKKKKALRGAHPVLIWGGRMVEKSSVVLKRKKRERIELKNKIVFGW